MICLKEELSEEAPQDPQHVSAIVPYHKSAGHPTNRNLARLVKNAGQPKWKVEEVMKFRCPPCESLKPGGTSSGNIPPASTAPMFKAWQAVGMDSTEWKIPGTRSKMKFLLIMDLATKLRVVCPIKIYDNFTTVTENTQDVIKCFAEGWLAHYPKPAMVVMDSASTFSGEQFFHFLNDLNIHQHLIPEKGPWANGMVEAAIQDVKHTATAIHLEAQDQDPKVTLALTVSALNSTEFTAGFSSHQWAFGSQYSLSDEDHRTFQQLETPMDFQRLVVLRQQAEEIAVKTRSQRALSKLANSSVRQPLREYKPMDLVKIWRRSQPTDQHQERRGGLKRSIKPHWVGPGRVIFQEVLPHQDPDDPRRHLLWVLVGRKLFRCSVHSVRLATETEKLEYQLSSDENPIAWRTLADILPKREYVDMADDVPDESEVEQPDLPKEPDDTTLVPLYRARQKSTYGPHDYRRVHRSAPLGFQEPPLPSVQHYLPGPAPASPSYAPTTPGAEVPDPRNADPTDGLRGSNDGLPASGSNDGLRVPPSDGLLEDQPVNEYEVVDDSPVEPPPEKRPRDGYDLKWVEQLTAEATLETNSMDLLSALQENDQCLVFNTDLAFDSKRQQKSGTLWPTW